MGKADKQVDGAGVAGGAQEMGAAPLVNTTRQLHSSKED